MKKTLIAILFLSSYLSLISENFEHTKSSKYILNEPYFEYSLDNENLSKSPDVKVFNQNKNNQKFLKIPDIRYTNLVPYVENSIFNYWNNRGFNIKPFSYEPTLGENGLLALISVEPDYTGSSGEPTFISKPESGGEPTSLNVYLYYSTDKGYSWLEKDLIYNYETESAYLVGPSFEIVNTNQNQNIGGLETGSPETFDYAVYARRVESGSNLFNGLSLLINLELLGELFPSEYRNPEINNSPDAQMWAGAVGAKSNAIDNSGVHFVSFLLSDGDISQYGYYGNIGVNTSKEVLTGNKVSEKFYADKFRPSTELSRSFQNRPNIGADQNGNFYIAINNIYNDDQENRYPAIWKSTNHGDTWSEPNKCPKAVLDEVGLNLGNNNSGYISIAYEQDAFVVYGEDKYSFFIRVVSSLGQSQIGIHIIEVNFEDGFWTARKVCDLSENVGNGINVPSVLAYSNRMKERFNIDDTKELPLLQRGSSRGHELEAALTADGNSIVVKYIDWSGSKTVTFEEPYTYYAPGLNEQQLDDTIAYQANYDEPNDIFIVTRDLDDNEWSEEINVTNDNWNYQRTFLPSVVPSKEEIPLVVGNSMIMEDESSIYYDAINKLDNSIWSQVSWNWFQSIDFVLLDGTKDASSGPAPWDVQSVKNTVNNDFKLLEPYPNPAINQDVELSFVLNKPGFIKITINDALGNLVEVAYEGNLSSGVQGFSIKTDKYSSGTYYVNLSVGNNTATKILNIVK